MGVALIAIAVQLHAPLGVCCGCVQSLLLVYSLQSASAVPHIRPVAAVVAGLYPHSVKSEFCSGLAPTAHNPSVQATASLLASGVDAHGVVVMDYGDFSVTLQHSKVSDSVLASEIQGEAGSLVIEKLSESLKVCFVPRGSQMQDLTQPQHINTMLYEAELFATLVDEHLVDHPGLAVSRITAKLLTEIRRQTGVIFPADSVKL